jgi:prepilin-type N-terminal cleavage/methylation domain-containing protein
MTRAPSRGRAGFTLMETIVTIVVMGVIAMVGYEAFTTLIDRRTQIRAAMEETERAAALRAMLASWFARSHLQGPTPSAPGMGSVGGTDKDMFSFITRAPTPSRGFATVMIMFIDENPSTPERGLTVRYLGYSANGRGVPWLTFDNSQAMQAQDSQMRRVNQSPGARQLDSTITGLRVEYLDQRTNRWLSTRNGSGMPMAARVTLLGSPRAPLPPLLQLPFVVAQQEQWQRRP